MRVQLARATIGLAFLGLVASACGPSSLNVAPGPKQDQKPNPVSVQGVQRAEIHNTLSYSGNIEPSSQISVIPKVNGRIDRLTVSIGDSVKSGDIIATIDSGLLDAQVAQAQAAVDAAQARYDQMEAGPRPEQVGQAKANLRAAQARLAALEDGPRAEQVAQAKASLDAAKAKLAQVQAGPTELQIQSAQLAIDQARNALYAAQLNKDGACNPHNPEFMCKSATASANAAETAVQQAQQQLAILTAPPTEETLAQLRASVDAANQQYELARKPYTQHDLDQAEAAVSAAAEQVKLAEDPYTAADLKVAQAAIDQAKAALGIVKLQQADAAVVAPVDGIVSQKFLDAGALAGPSTPIITLISRAAQVTISVEEAKLNLVAPGQSAKVLVSAYPNVQFKAKVVGDPPTIDPRTRTAQIRLIPSDPEELLKPGMFAQVSIDSAVHPNALIVPQSALVSDNGATSVYVVENGIVRVQPVTTGISDGSNIEILEGLDEGSMVVVGDKPTLHTGDKVTPNPAGR